MKAGKLKESILKRSVLKQLHKRNETTIIAPMVGGDFGAVSVNEEYAVTVSSEPITLTQDAIGSAAIYAACNDVACSGAKPVGVSVVVLVPTSTNEEEIRNIIKDIDAACEVCGVDVLSGHTEVTRVVKEPLVTVTTIGAGKKDQLIHSSKMLAGMDIVATKWFGLEGTAILSKEKEEVLCTRYAKPFIDRAKTFDQMMSVLPEAAVAVQSGAGAMHDVSEGGVFGALWEMAESAGVGLEIDLKKIPIRQETVEICECLDVNPYKLLSGGCLLIATEDGNGLVMELEKVNIPAVIIGKAIEGNDRVLINDDERRFLETAQTDELYIFQ